jgi:hypothetical protein
VITYPAILEVPRALAKHVARLLLAECVHLVDAGVVMVAVTGRRACSDTPLGIFANKLVTSTETR